MHAAKQVCTPTFSQMLFGSTKTTWRLFEHSTELCHLSRCYQRIRNKEMALGIATPCPWCGPTLCRAYQLIHVDRQVEVPSASETGCSMQRSNESFSGPSYVSGKAAMTPGSYLNEKSWRIVCSIQCTHIT